jgi:hypothetical protein
MPRTSFNSLPNSARLWVFACDPAPSREQAQLLLAETDEFLDRWQAHGNPLTCAREWRDDRFLAVSVDQSTEGASGCSIDGLFRTLRALESRMESKLVGGGSVFYRDESGKVCCVTRAEFTRLAAEGSVTEQTTVFDTSLTTAGDWRSNFQRAVAASWHAALLPRKAAAT